MPISRYAGFGKETVYGTAVPAAFHVDIASATLDTPTDTELQHGGGFGRSANLHRPGYYAPAGNVVYPFDINTVGWFLRWCLGGYAYTATPDTPPVGTHLHEIYGDESNALPSFTSRIGKDLFEHVFTGCNINSVEIAVSDAFAQLTADIIAQKDAKAALTASAALLVPASYPLAFHEVTGKIATVDQSALIRSITLNIANNVDAASGRSIGSRHPRLLLAGQRAVTFQAELRFVDTAQLERFWGGSTGPSATGPEEFAMEFTFDAGDDGVMTLLLPRTIYTGVQTQASGRDVLYQTVNGMAYLDTVTLEDDSEVATEILASIYNDITTLA